MAKRQTVLQAATAKLGVHKGALAAANAAQWAMATADLGHVPTTVEYSEWWNIDERTGWRHRARVREALGDDWPTVVEALAAEISKRSLRSPRSVVALPA
jgi:hypothetical protein